MDKTQRLSNWFYLLTQFEKITINRDYVCLKSFRNETAIMVSVCLHVVSFTLRFETRAGSRIRLYRMVRRLFTVKYNVFGSKFLCSNGGTLSEFVRRDRWNIWGFNSGSRIQKVDFNRVSLEWHSRGFIDWNFFSSYWRGNFY